LIGYGSREEERKAHPEQNPINREQVFAAGKSLLNGMDARSNLRFIYRWKLRSFIRRFKWVREFPDTVSDAVLNDAIKAAREAVKNPSEKELVRVALVALEKMKHVGVPVSSAFLTAMDPTQFTIIDRQAFKALGAPFRASASVYLDYLWFCRSEAERLGVTLNEHDRALWQRGVEMGRV
jgi:thermostable 8-oxoguanine DNA glycosylase